MSLMFTRRRLLATGALLPLSACITPQLDVSSAGFTHGVASGEPGQTSAVLWTRYVGAEPTRLRVEIARDEAFSDIIATSSAQASPATDWCARANASGLPSGRWLYYRFRAPNGQTSPIGRTRTLPDGRIDSFRIAVFSCSNAGSGWFNAYAHAAARDDIDLAVHLGDYIYESPVSRPDAAPGLPQQRGIQPPHEIVSLADYRQRYATYRDDPDLAELHRRLPMISVWDDHETANNSWRDGASAHNPATEGEWAPREAAGVRAYREWLPMADRWWDSYRIGDLATIFRLETRLVGRDEQLEDALEEIVESGDANLRQRLEAFKNGPLAAASRSMMGAEQERWLADGMRASVNAGQRWQILAQQVIMGGTVWPQIGPQWFAPNTVISPEDQASFAARKTMTEIGMPFSLDKWDGYPAARQRIYDAARAARANLVTLTGDSHNAWAFDLADSAGPAGVEFAGQSVSSFGYERRFAGDPLRIAADYTAANPNLKWMDASQRGYFTLDIRRDRVEADYVFVAARDGRSAASQGRKLIAAEYGARRLSI